MKQEPQNKLGRGIETWHNKLLEILHENALLKYLLSEIVDENEDKNFLPLAEYFQNELLLKDEKLRILLNEITGFAATCYENPEEKHKGQYEKLRQEILGFEKIHEAFSNDFKSKCYKKSMN